MIQGIFANNLLTLPITPKVSYLHPPVLAPTPHTYTEPQHEQQSQDTDPAIQGRAPIPESISYSECASTAQTSIPGTLAVWQTCVSTTSSSSGPGTFRLQSQLNGAHFLISDSGGRKGEV